MQQQKQEREGGRRGRERCISGFKIRKSAYDTTHESGEEGGREDAVKL